MLALELKTNLFDVALREIEGMFILSFLLANLKCVSLRESLTPKISLLSLLHTLISSAYTSVW